jgi:hypothetical protein
LKAGDSADSYTLSDLKWGGSSKSGSGAAGGAGGAGAVGTSGTAPAGLSSASTLTVKASGGAKLSEHVGHQVEISGTVADKDKSSSSSTSASPSTSPTGDPASRSASSSSSPTFEAKSVKMIAASCSM